MLRCNVHNLVTDQRYQFDAADQAEIDARLERKAGTYGRAAWTETIPGWTQTGVWTATGYDEEAVIEHPKQVVEHPSEREVIITDLAPQEQAAARYAAIMAVQARLDTLAQSWGYDSIISGCSYASSKIPRFRAEGEVLSDFRDATWFAVDQHSTAQSIEELFSYLPDIPIRPHVIPK